MPSNSSENRGGTSATVVVLRRLRFCSRENHTPLSRFTDTLPLARERFSAGLLKASKIAGGKTVMRASGVRRTWSFGPFSAQVSHSRFGGTTHCLAISPAWVRLPKLFASRTKSEQNVSWYFALRTFGYSGSDSSASGVLWNGATTSIRYYRPVTGFTPLRHGLYVLTIWRVRRRSAVL